MKKLVGALILGLTLVGLSGCNSENKSDTQSGTTTGSTTSNEKPLKIGIVFDKGGIDDKSFNASAFRGLERAKTELGVEIQTLESREEKDYESNLESMVEKGCDLVIGVGINMQAAVDKVAGSNPDSKFALVDATCDKPNVRGLKFKEEEGSFLAGYLAGMMTTTKKLGFVGGQKIPLIEKFYAGYAAGALTADKTIEILPAKYTGDWNNVDVAKEAAKALFSGGADIVYHAAGKAGLGVINAAQEAKKFAIGVDSDQDMIAEGFVLTSMVKKVDEAVFQTIKDLKDGKYSAGETTYDLKSGGVALSEMKFTKDKIGADKLAKVKEIEAKITSGEIAVPMDLASFEAYKSSLK